MTTELNPPLDSDEGSGASSDMPIKWKDNPEARLFNQGEARRARKRAMKEKPQPLSQRGHEDMQENCECRVNSPCKTVALWYSSSEW
ncbi:hypothetical protein DVH05_014137 [Phytophthora capsici]|nr:hypothetical protein DVH05_014137 [Phytophthora capsici]